MTKNIKYSKGSEWRKWDLHIHTPYSNEAYGDYKEEKIWAEFVKELEDSDLSVIGVNDYSILEGYWKLKEFKSKGRLKNIDLILPVIEYRINCFSGDDEKWKKINLHILLSDDLSKDILQKYILDEINKDVNDKKKYTSYNDFAKGNKKLSELTINFDKTLEHIHSCEHIKDKYLIGLGYNEWDNLSFKNNKEAKERIVSECDFLFASSSAKAYGRRLKKIPSIQNPPLIINASDKHNFKDKSGHCNDFSNFSWVKSDPTFDGLKMVLQEPERIQVTKNGLNPEEEINKHYVVNEISFINQEFFKERDVLELNDGLVSIIGNKGSGKSVLGALINYNFDKIYENLSKKYKGILKDKDNIPEIKSSIDNNNIGSKYIKYLSQNYIDNLVKDNKELENLLKELIEGHSEKIEVRRFDESEHGHYQNNLNNTISFVNRNANIKSRITDSRKNISVLEKQEQENKQKKEDYTKVVSENEDYKKYKKFTKGVEVLEEEKSSLGLKIEALKTIEEILEKFEVCIKDNFISPIKGVLKSVEGDSGLEISPDEYIIYKKDELYKDIQSKKSYLETEIKDKQQKIEEKEQCKKKLADKLGDVVDKDHLMKLDDNEKHNKKELKEAREEEKKLVLTGQRVEAENKKCKELFVEYIEKQSNEKTYLLKIKDSIDSEIKDLCSKYENNHANLSKELKKITFDVVYCTEFYDKYIENIVELFDARKNNLNRDELQKAVKENINDSTEEIDSGVENLYDYLMGYYERKALREKNSIDDYFRNIFNLKIEMKYSLKYNGTEFCDLSSGQRGTVILVLLLLLDKKYKDKILIIDQPEDNLDNRTVNKVLVPAFKIAKEKRQIFLITHNANLVVNSDSEQIVVAQDLRNIEGDKLCIEYISGSLEDANIKNSICDILEGGKEAFEKRGKKMSFIKN